MPYFWQLAINPKLKIQWFPLGMLILTFENSTTCIAILLNGGDLQVLWRRQMRMKTSFKNYRAVGIRDAGWGEFAPLDLDWDRKKKLRHQKTLPWPICKPHYKFPIIRILSHFKIEIAPPKTPLSKWELQFWIFSECEFSPLVNRTH